MLQDLRSGQRAFLVDVANQDDRHAARLGKAEQGRGAFAHLCDAAWRGIHVFGGNRLDGVDDYDFGLHLFYICEDVLKGCFGQDEQIVLLGIHRCLHESFGAHLQLVGAFLTAHVEYLPFSHAEHGLQGQRTLADAWFAAQQDDAAGHQSATQHPVQFSVVHIDARFVLARNIAQSHGTVLAADG